MKKSFLALFLLFTGIAFGQNAPANVLGYNIPANTIPSVNGFSNGYPVLGQSGMALSPDHSQLLFNGAPINNATTQLGIVNTRNEMPTNSTGSNTWSMGRFTTYARVAIAAKTMHVNYANFYVPNTNIETALTGSSTYKVSIEYPSGVFTPCTFAGQATGTATGIVTIHTDGCGPAIPNGARFWVRLLFTNPNGIIYNQNGSNHYSFPSNPLAGDAFVFGTGTPADYTASTAVGSGSPVFTAAGASLLAPVAILGPTNRPYIVAIGDSRCTGLGDTNNDQTGDVGELGRPMGAVLGYTKICASGTKIADFLTAGNATGRINLINNIIKPPLVIDSYGVNDIFAGTAVSTVVANRNSVAALWPNAVSWGTTIPPETTTKVFVLTAAGAASGGSTVYTGTLANCGSNACIGALYTVAGFTNAGNNGSFVATASSTTTITLTNGGGVAETHAGTVTDNWASTFNQASSNATNTLHLYQFNQQQALRGTIFNEARELDINQVVDPGYSGLWCVSALTSASFNALTQTWCSTDGIHEAWPANNLIANRLLYAFASLIR